MYENVGFGNYLLCSPFFMLVRDHLAMVLLFLVIVVCALVVARVSLRNCTPYMQE